jgi:2',3'-cyclic-nucleotide 2'-phosphodiesterase (5'-nucleotidase family)
VTVVHLNDTGPLSAAGWARLAAVIAGLRRRGACDVLLHAGDLDLGAVHLGAPDPERMVALLNRLRFDAVAVGNHDLDAGVEALGERTGPLRAPLLCANLDGAGTAPVRPFRVLRRRGTRIAVVGVTLGEMASYQPARRLAGLCVADPVETLRRVVPAAGARAALVVVLSHCGYEVDRAIAREVGGVDLVVGGHSHFLLEEPVRHGAAWVVQAGADGGHVGWVTLDPAGDGSARVRGGVIPAGAVEPDRNALRLLAAAPESADDDVIGFCAVELADAGDDWESPRANFGADALRAHAATDVALLRRASVRGTLPAGPIRRRDLRLLNWNGADRIARLRLSGAELVRVLERGARAPYFLLASSGARVVYDADRPPGERVRSVEVAGAALDPRRVYSVACSEILALGASGLVPPGTPHELLADTVGDVLAWRVAACGTIRPTADGRVVVHGRFRSTIDPGGHADPP